jgi:hypothetical protein
VSGAIYFATTYALGILSASFSRALLDFISERWLRKLIFSRAVHGKRDTLCVYYKNRTKFPGNKERFEADIEWETSRGKKAADDRRIERAEWNAIYRSAIRFSVHGNQEVSRRRAQGRLTRSLLVPIVIGAGTSVYFGLKEYLLLSILWILVGAAVIGAGLLVAFLYSYSELNVMAEAHDVNVARKWTVNESGKPLTASNAK